MCSLATKPFLDLQDLEKDIRGGERSFKNSGSGFSRISPVSQSRFLAVMYVSQSRFLHEGVSGSRGLDFL